MISAGNDIVALNVIDKERTCQPIFYSKFITPSEFELYKSSELPFEHFVWLLWSAKESAYKYLKRGDASLVFSPSKLIVQEIAVCNANSISQFVCDETISFFYTGIISSNLYELHFKSAVNNNFIATSINNGDTYWGVRKIDGTAYNEQSTGVRHFALTILNNSLMSDSLRFEKHPAGYPLLYDGEQQTNVSVSFAHHDSYVSYSFQIPK